MILCLLCFLVSAGFAQSPVTITVDSRKPGREIPADFAGESFETASIRINNRGVKGYMFDSTDRQMIALFKSLGIKSLRIGGGTVDNTGVNPTHNDIDALFRFAKAAGVKVIYSLRLLNGDAKEDASIAKYVWGHHRQYLDCFAIGNEPDWHSFHIRDPEIYETDSTQPGTAFPSYIAKWKRFAKMILDSVPHAKFSGPNSGSNFPVTGAKNTGDNGTSWTSNFIDEEKNSGIISFFTQHNYVGQSTNDKTAPEVIEKMLCPDWDARQYPALYDASCAPALASGFRFRLTESNCFSEGIDGASNAFATALFALDYLHWWSAHNAAGINFHTTQWRYNATFRLDVEGNYHINPMGYGIAAFTIGSHGKIKPVTISNPENVNLTAYGAQDADSLFVTIINKEHGSNPRDASVTIRFSKPLKDASVMFLSVPNGDVYAKTGMTLGGVAITNDGQWQGKWTLLHSNDSENCALTVPFASAAIVKILATQ
ncbi:MAG: hypothetical protein KGJ59_08015 [Bacteroidota bacterium]|nr:hypothetical protein [Bacteroidota bacterium]